MLLMGFKLMAGAIANCAFLGVAVGVGILSMVFTGAEPLYFRRSQ